MFSHKGNSLYELWFICAQTKVEVRLVLDAQTLETLTINYDIFSFISCSIRTEGNQHEQQ